MQSQNSQPAVTSRPLAGRRRLPWLLLLLALGLLLLLTGTGYWRASGVGPQVQVPMFYDAHYLYPRPWTQEQAAPGIPDTAPLALYGANEVRQSFVAGSDQLALVTIPLAGPGGSRVTAMLSDDQGAIWTGEIVLEDAGTKRPYALAFEPIAEAHGRSYEVVLRAPEAAIAEPVLVFAVGGDRLGASYDVNPFSRPGNLELVTYAHGRPGGWWAAAVSEQLLPALFRLRLQQYKPPAFKGQLFAWLLGATMALSGLLLCVAQPSRRAQGMGTTNALGWLLVLAVSGFLAWQLASGRLLVAPPPGQTAWLTAAGEATATAQDGGVRRLLYKDLTADLWTAAREPEARLVSTAVVDGLPAILAPAGSRVRYALDAPPDGRLRVGLAASGEGPLAAEIRVNDEVVAGAEALRPGAAVQWLEVDLHPWQGQGFTLTLAAPRSAAGGTGEVLWLMPQITMSSDWLLAALPEDIEREAGHEFAGMVTLLGADLAAPPVRAGETVNVGLFWQALADEPPYGTVFVHLLDEAGQLVAQHDAQPVGNALPFPQWRAGQIVRDDHSLALPADLVPGSYQLHVGIYDPQTGARWPVTNPDGSAAADDRALLAPAVEVAP